MRDEVKRYWLTNDGMRESAVGAYVFWDAYAKMEAENAELKEETYILQVELEAGRLKIEDLKQKIILLKNKIEEREILDNEVA